MDPATISLLCAPGTHEPLRLHSEIGSAGEAQEYLVGERSGTKYEIRDGIPILLRPGTISGFNLRYQGFYDKSARFYDTAMRLAGRLAGGGEGRFRAQFLQDLGLVEGARLLEVSIGTGANLHFLPVRAECYGLDLSWGMLSRCRQNLARWGLQAELIQGNAEELPLRDESFDAVLHVGGINAFNDRAAAISEMIRVARSGSRIVIADETAKLMESLRWMPSVKRWLEQDGQRFGPPLDLIPEGMLDVQVQAVARGNLYCLAFRKP